MEFWNKKINVSKESAEQQIAIINKFSSEKRLSIALDFANFGIGRTREWIRNSNPSFSELEVNLEFVRLMYYETGEITEEYWQFYSEAMKEKIRKDWSKRFREMMKDNQWSYEDVAELGDFKSGKVIESTISRGLPSFAKLSVVIHELNKSKEMKAGPNMAHNDHPA
ncbi:MAG: hypothetical protein H6557_16585 [Lewinellaceae bacterium]|nr:hypothetical protein [Lewinellaceae bacterium]